MTKIAPDSNDEREATDLSRREAVKRFGVAALGVAGGLDGAGVVSPDLRTSLARPPPSRRKRPLVDRVAANPTEIPGPIRRSKPRNHRLRLTTREVRAEIEAGFTFDYMPYNEQVPGPLIRVRQGDRIHLTFENPSESRWPHNVDFHAVYGPGGGSVATTANPGQEKHLAFRTVYPGAFIYHCAVPRLDYHISSGMFGMILVEPPEGLPEVDREFYLGQHEVYTRPSSGEEPHLRFDHERMQREDPAYVLLNGEHRALTPENRGAIQVRTGETARIFFVNGGPNLTSSFHPIGNVWTRVWRDGALASSPERYVQTVSVPPGSCTVAEMEFPVPGQVKLVDHALTRVSRKGMLGLVDVQGEATEDIFEPEPGAP